MNKMADRPAAIEVNPEYVEFWYPNGCVQIKDRLKDVIISGGGRGEAGRDLGRTAEDLDRQDPEDKIQKARSRNSCCAGR